MGEGGAEDEEDPKGFRESPLSDSSKGFVEAATWCVVEKWCEVYESGVLIGATDSFHQSGISFSTLPRRGGIGKRVSYLELEIRLSCHKI